MKKPTIDQMSAELRANGKAKFLESSKIKDRLYHGTRTTEGGKGKEAIRKFKPSKEGALGSGVYLTPKSKFASTYAEDMGGNVLPVHAQIKNPLVLHGHPDPDKYLDPMVEALTKLGMDANKAHSMVNRAYEGKGYIGKEVESRAKAAGYDGLMQYHKGDLSEVVSYNPRSIKSAIGNRGTYDVNDPDITKAKGGIIHKADGGKVDDDDYRGSHEAPGPHYGAPMHDVSSGGMYPSDFYSHKGRQYYANEGWDFDHDAYNKVTRVKNKPNEMVSIYRAIPSSIHKTITKESEKKNEPPNRNMIRKGDWVAINKEYAKAHGESALNGNYKIASLRVPARHVWTNADSIHEWGYHPDQVVHKADGGTIQRNQMDTPTLAQMRLKLNQSNNPNYMDSIGVEQAVDMNPKKYITPSPSQNGFVPVGGVSDRNGLPVGGVDQNNTQPGQQFMDQNMGAQQNQDQQPNPSPDGTPPAEQEGLPGGGNMLSMTPQGQMMQAMGPAQGQPPGMAKGGSAYAKAPHSLMGYKKEGPHKSFNESNYKHTAYVKVHHGTDQHVDAVKGLNHSHAMARAKLNWPTASRIEGITEQEASKIDPDVVKMAKGGKVGIKGIAVIRAKMMMLKKPIKKLADGGKVDEPYSETDKPGRILFHGKGHGDTKGIIVPRHMWEGTEGVFEKGKKKGQTFKIDGMGEINKARAKVYGSENRDPLTIGQIGRVHKNVLDEHFAKPLSEQKAAEDEALNRLRAARHIGDDANTLDESEKLDTVKHERDEQGRSHVGYAAKGVAGHSLYTSGHGDNKQHHIINTCPGQTVGCGGGHDANGIVDTMKGSCFAPNAESQYVSAAIRRACHEQAKHDPKMTRDWILAHTGSLRKVSDAADKKNVRTLFRPNVVDETDTSSRHVIRHLNKQRSAKGKPDIISNQYGKTNELHDPENGYYVTHSNIGPKVKHGMSIAENIARDKQRVRSTITATEASGKDFTNEQGNKTPPKGSYFVTDVKRKSPMQKEMEKHIKHIKYWSTGKPVNELSKEEKAEDEEGHFDGNGKPTTEDKAHYGHMTFDDKRYDYQKQHVLHPRLVNVPERKENKDTGKMETVEHMIPTDSRFMDEQFLPKKRFKTKNGKVAGHILMTTPTESTSNVGHETTFTHHVGEHNIDYAKRNKGEYEVDSPMQQAMAEGKEYIKPEPIKIVRKVKAVKKADGGRVEFTPHDYDDDFNCFPERNYIAQHHLANRVGIEDETEVPAALLKRPKD